MKRSDQRKKWAKAYKDNRFVYTYIHINNYSVDCSQDVPVHTGVCVYGVCTCTHVVTMPGSSTYTDSPNT